MGALSWLIWDTIIHFDVEVSFLLLGAGLLNLAESIPRWHASGSM